MVGGSIGEPTNKIDSELILQNSSNSAFKYVQKYRTAFKFTLNTVHLQLLKLIQETLCLKNKCSKNAEYFTGRF